MHTTSRWTQGRDGSRPTTSHAPARGYDRGRITTGVVHIGVGAFHRAHQAMYHDRLLSAGAGAQEWGICGVGVMPAA